MVKQHFREREFQDFFSFFFHFKPLYIKVNMERIFLIGYFYNLYFQSFNCRLNINNLTVYLAYEVSNNKVLITIITASVIMNDITQNIGIHHVNILVDLNCLYNICLFLSSGCITSKLNCNCNVF